MHFRPGTTRVSRAALLSALTLLAGCGNIQNAGSVFKRSSTVDDINGRLADNIDVTTIDYSSQNKARMALAERKVNPQYPGEAHIGLIDHSRLTSGQTVVYDPQVEAFILQIVDRLLEHWHGKKPSVRVAFVVDTPEAQFEAESGADGTMYFGLSAIRDVESTDELAFKTAHELAHILMNHTVRVDQEKEAKKAEDSAGNLAILANSAVNSGTSAAAGNNSNIAYAMASLNILMNDVLSPAFSRQQEREADLIGTDLMLQAGYSPRAINFVMQRLHDQERKAAEAEKKLREEQLEAERKKQGLKTPAGQTAGAPAGVSSFFDQLRGMGKEITASHPEAEDRERDVVRYVEREYSVEKRTHRNLREEEYQKFKLSVSAGPLMRRQFSVFAEDSLKAGRLDEAYTYALRALGDSKDPAAGPRLVLYRIRKAQAEKTGNRKFKDEALKHLEIAWAGPEGSSEIAVILAGEYTESTRYDQADHVLAEAGQRLANPYQFYGLRIANFVIGKRKDQAFSVTYQCDQPPVAPPVRVSCRAALPDAWQEEYAGYATVQENLKKKAAS